MSPDKIAIEPTYKKENGVWLLSLDAIPVPIYFRPKEKSVICIPAGTIAGNHRHQRTELFIGFGENLELVYLDSNNQQKVEKMNPDGKLYVFKIPPFLPHAVRNTSDIKDAFLLEYANGPQRGIEPASVI